jgi:6-pyruvoyltetrahydropterin/6-carboxytetrahydropterin synthase
MADLEFSRRYSMAHRLINDPHGPCATPHGHNEIVTVRLAPTQKFRFGGANALAPFDDIKGRWKQWIDGAVDHAFQLNEADPLIAYFRAREPARLARIMTFAGDPTTEALAAAFWLKLSAFLVADGLPFAVTEVRIEETPSNTIVLGAANFDPRDCALPASAWPRRADMSINEF